MLVNVTNRLGGQKIGSVSKSNKSASIRAGEPIEDVAVYQDYYQKVCVSIKAGGKSCFLYLNSQGVVDLATALVKNLSDVTIATADELLKVIAEAKQRSDDEAKAMIDCLQERHKLS